MNYYCESLINKLREEARFIRTKLGATRNPWHKDRFGISDLEAKTLIAEYGFTDEDRIVFLLGLALLKTLSETIERLQAVNKLAPLIASDPMIVEVVKTLTENILLNSSIANIALHYHGLTKTIREAYCTVNDTTPAEFSIYCQSLLDKRTDMTMRLIAPIVKNS